MDWVKEALKEVAEAEDKLQKGNEKIYVKYIGILPLVLKEEVSVASEVANKNVITSKEILEVIEMVYTLNEVPPVIHLKSSKVYSANERERMNDILIPIPLYRKYFRLVNTEAKPKEGVQKMGFTNESTND